MKGEIVKAAWVPGLPHILSKNKCTQWTELANAFTKLGERVREVKPDVIVLFSTQWFSVLGTSFQTNPNPKGLHVDENWYDLGDLPFNFKVDSALSTQFAEDYKGAGFPTKTVNFEEFPIDTATIVANHFLNPKGDIPVSIVSSWVYADHKAARTLGETMAKTVEKAGKRAVFVASSLLSSRFNSNDIDPNEDKIISSDDEANKKILHAIESGKWYASHDLASEFSRKVPTDMQFNAFHWLSGVLGSRPNFAEVLGYGPQWGTGAAVIDISLGVKH